MTGEAVEEASVTHRGNLMIFPTPLAYADAWELQQRLHRDRLVGRCPDTLLLLQHRPVFTLGRRTLPAHLPGGEQALRRSGAAVEHVTRGGSVTYHGPGQLLCYPIVKLARIAPGPKLYVRLLEEMVIAVLADWDLEGMRVEGAPGIWVRTSQGLGKVASIGVRIDRGVTMHGLALNVDLDLTPFSLVVPCGLEFSNTTSMAEASRSPMHLPTVAEQVAEHCSRRLRLAWQTRPMDAIHTADTSVFTSIMEPAS